MPNSIILNSSTVFSKFGEYIIDTYFSEAQKGEEIYPIIDEYYIQQFCSLHKIKKTELVRLLNNTYIHRVNQRSNINDIVGFIGIQLYAASKMENKGSYSSTNFRDRICERSILNIELTEWQQWATENQDAIWSRYYEWCQRNDFIISNICRPRKGKDRYVQYPKVHSELVLNREDLKRIAYIFVQNHLMPDEDISETDFWKTIQKYKISYSSYCSNRASKILYENSEIAYKQIYQFYLLWDGEYIDGNKTKKSKNSLYELHLLHSKDEWSIDITNAENGRLIENVHLDDNKILLKIRKYYTFKYSNVILFSKNGTYDDYWDEQRFVEEDGLALYFDASSNFTSYHQSDIIRRFDRAVLVKLSNKKSIYQDFFATERPYSLVGGIKIGTNTYLSGCPPLLELRKDINVWLDGKAIACKIGMNHFQLSEGHHQIKVRGYKKIDLVLKPAKPDISFWKEIHKWDIKKNGPSTWSPSNCDNGVIGLDFSEYTTQIAEEKQQGNPLTEWCKVSLFRLRQNNIECNNIAVKLKRKNNHG